MNDSAYIDMARHFAYRLQNEAGNEVKQQIEKGYQLATHPIDDKSLAALLELYNKAYSQFKKMLKKHVR